MLFSNQIARYVVALAWLYHGLFPKLLQIAPLELLMSSSVGLSEEATYILIKVAGVAEVIWGVVFFVFYKFRVILYINILALSGLLIAVVLLLPQILLEAFNPVTTNIPLIALSLIILNNINSKVDPSNL